MTVHLPQFETANACLSLLARVMPIVGAPLRIVNLHSISLLLPIIILIVLVITNSPSVRM